MAALDRSAVPRLSKRAQRLAKKLAKRRRAAKGGRGASTTIGPTATLAEFYARGGEALMRQTVVILIGIASGGAGGATTGPVVDEGATGDLMGALRPNAAGRRDSGESSGGGGPLAKVLQAARSRVMSRGAV